MSVKANIVIDQGADFTTYISLTDDNDEPIDVSVFTGAAQMRKFYTSSKYYTFNVSFEQGTGSVVLSMPANKTAVIPPGRYLYDCEIYNSAANTTTRLVEGIVTVTPGVTR